MNKIAQNQTDEGNLEYNLYQNRHPFLFLTLSSMNEEENLLKCNQTQPTWINGEFGSPLFFWELVLDVFLSSVLVAFLNYQVIKKINGILIKYFSLKPLSACLFLEMFKLVGIPLKCNLLEVGNFCFFKNSF